ncbi:alpha/beta hydrolase family protein [Thermoplasmatota archaeon]
MKKYIFTVLVILCIIPLNSIGSVDYYQISIPDQPGPYLVGYYRISYNVPPFGKYSATIRYPAKFNGWRTPPQSSNKTYPGIIVGNGFAGSDWNIKWIPNHLTSHGFITICFTPPDKYLGNTTQWSYGFIGGFDKLSDENNRYLSPIYGLINIEKIGVIGLSMGGAGCIEATGNKPLVIDAAVALAPAKSDFSESAAMNISVPIQIQVGSDDSMIQPKRVIPYYNIHISNDTIKEYLEINGGNHIGYIDYFYARFAEWMGLDESHGIQFSEQHRISSKYFTSWFYYYLKDQDEYYTYIFGVEAINDYDSRILSEFKFHIP